MKILVLDNYDSFTYNLVHIIRELGFGENMEVYRNDKISLDDVNAYNKVLLSPGPGVPKDAGIMPGLLRKYSPSKSIFGVCLGHQAIAENFGTPIYNMPNVLHGIATETIVKEKSTLFVDLPETFMACRYHSWSINPQQVSEELMVTAVDENGEIMAIKHKQHQVYGVQFHPESYLTEYGIQMVQNWLNA